MGAKWQEGKELESPKAGKPESQIEDKRSEIAEQSERLKRSLAGEMESQEVGETIVNHK